jgi:hypothetical protein
VIRSLDGDEDAFVEVVRRHEATVGTYLARRGGRELAQDLLSEVWVAALASRAKYDRSFPDAGPPVVSNCGQVLSPDGHLAVRWVLWPSVLGGCGGVRAGAAAWISPGH